MGRHLERDVLALGYLVLNGRLGFAARLAEAILREHQLRDDQQILMAGVEGALRDEDPQEAEVYLRRLLSSGMPRQPHPAPGP